MKWSGKGKAEKKASKKPRRHILRTILIVLAAVAVALALGIHIYASGYYHAEPEAQEALASTTDVTVTTLDSGDVLFVPKNADAAFVFYPGGKVEATAYAPLLARLADRGVACVLVKMPENLAVLASNAADHARPELEEALSDAGEDSSALPWLIGGHSLGGAMAGSYVAGHEESYRGLVLLGAYETSDINSSSLSVLLMYGEHDGVLNRTKYDECLENLPSVYTELIIPGGIHSYFGSYGLQEGDGMPEITNAEQLDFAASAIADFAGTLSVS